MSTMQDDTVCELCGHPAWYHRYDDSGPSPTDPEAVARCIWPVLAPHVKPVTTCTCPDFMEPAR